MKINKIFPVIVFSMLSVTGCVTEKVSNNANVYSANTNVNANAHANHDMANMNSAPEKQADFKIELSPATAEAGKETEFIFTVKDKSGNAVKNFKVVHEKKMHLIAVSEDLAEFEHLHPDLQPDGTFKIRHTFNHGGKFVLYPDVTPEGGSQTVETIALQVGGTPKTPQKPVVDTDLTKTVDGLKVTMKPETELKSNQPVTIDFIVNDAASDKPVSDLEKYLGELAHVVAISEDTKDFLHVHPHGEVTPAETKVSAQTTFPRAGIYKTWVQFQRAGKIITVPFVIEVKQGEAKSESAAKLKDGAITIKVDGKGYTPASIEAEKGKTVKLLFTRTDDKNCGNEVVFPSLNIKKELPVGKEVAVEITPKESGEITFNCGMNMYKGKLVVE